MTEDQARQLGYELAPASRYEIGLLKNGKGIRTWWASIDGLPATIPPMSHSAIQKAIEINERMERSRASKTPHPLDGLALPQTVRDPA